MAKQKDFDAFLHNIEPSKSTVQYISSVQNNLRNHLRQHKTYSRVHKETFLSGSYAKHTSIRPAKEDNKRDVDIIVVTTHSQNDDSSDVLQELYDALIASCTYKSAIIQHHSVGIDLSQLSIDVVPVIVDEDDDSLYWVADSEDGTWIKSDPKGHINWSTKTNQDNNDNYKPLVKIFKWWRRKHCPGGVKYPKGITLEKIIADNLGDSTSSTEDFLIETMQNMVSVYKETYVDVGINPYIDDPSSKIDSNDLLDGYTTDDFKGFILKIDEHIKLLNDNGSESETWRTILGSEFPKGQESKSLYNLLACKTASHRQKPAWPVARGGAVIVTLRVQGADGCYIAYESNGQPLGKHCSLHFKALTGINPPYTIKWQITNTGDEATQAQCLRGDFYDSNEGVNGRVETTQYTGTHSVQCFVIKRGICVARSKDFIINIF
jgi:hypothetical protein